MQRASGRPRLVREVGLRSSADVLYKFFLGTVNQSAAVAVVVGLWLLVYSGGDGPCTSLNDIMYYDLLFRNCFVPANI